MARKPDRDENRERRRLEDRIPRLDRNRQRTLSFGMGLVYWAAAAVCFLVAITVLTNLGSGEKPDSEYLLVAGLVTLFGLLLVWAGFRSYRSASTRDDE